MSLMTLEDLFVHELKDLYSAEKQLLKALPRMAKAASSNRLREAFESHLSETEEHVSRLEGIFHQLGKHGRGAKCPAMEGLVTEEKDLIHEKADPCVKDAGLIAAAQRVEHYEIAGYGTARTYARMLEHAEAERLLQQTLDEEKETDQQLTDLAESEINVEAQKVMA